MEDIKRCQRCILPASLPSVSLDKRDICIHCNNYEFINKDWEELRAQRKAKFEEMIEQAKRLNRPYDCLVPLSGGKDSTYVLYLCDKVYKMKCLCITFDNGYLADRAKENIVNALRAINADHIFYTVNRNLMLKLYRLFIEKCGNFCSVCMRGIELSLQMACRSFGIPLLITGAGKRVRYLGIIPELFEEGNPLYFKNVVKGTLLETEVQPMLVNSQLRNIPRLLRKNVRKIKRIFNPSTTRRVGIYDYIDVSYDEIYETISAEMGWEIAGARFEHMDCIIHEIASYIHTLKFHELTNSTIYHSGLIRLGQMTRGEALSIEEEKLSNPQVPHFLVAFLKEIGLSKDQFESYVRDWTSIEKYRS